MTNRTILQSVFIPIVFFAPMSARWAFADEDPPPLLSQLEQAGRVSGLASQALASKLFPKANDAAAQAPYFQRDYREPWQKASLSGRINRAEKIGNQGRARFAFEQRYEQLLGSGGRGLPQGLDSLYWDPRTGRVRVFEAKGGSSPVKRTYESWQGTNRNALRSAEFVLKSKAAGQIERVEHAIAIKAAQQNRLESIVVRTGHNAGVPSTPRLEGAWSTHDVAREAIEIERRSIRQNPALASAFRQASAELSTRVLQFHVRQKGPPVLGLVGSTLLLSKSIQQFADGWTTWTDPNLRDTALPYLRLAHAGGTLLESTSLGAGSASTLGILGKGKLNALGRGAGKAFLPIALAVESLTAGTASYEYTTGRISQREFYRRTTGPAIFTVFTTVGAIVGFPAGGVGAVPGAAIGATVAVPIQFVADWIWDWYYSKFDEKQRAAVDEALERYYGAPSSP